MNRGRKGPSWTRFSEVTKAELIALEEDEKRTAAGIPQRLLDYMASMAGAHSPNMPLNAANHCRQTATRAHRDGKDEEYVVCALLHDIGEFMSTLNHGDFAAAILRPYVSEANHWMIKHHPIFQGHYFFEHLGIDPNVRERFRDQPHYEHTVEFCDKYDQVAFDPGYDSLPFEFFEPMVMRMLAKPRAAADGAEAGGPLAMQEAMAGA